MNKRVLFAFTLAEILIVLAIVGIIAVLTIPTLMEKINERIIVAKLEKVYSTLSQACKLSVVDNGEVDSWDIGQIDTSDGAQKVANYLIPYIKTAKVCGKNSGCFASSYKALGGSNWGVNVATHSAYVRYILFDGVSIAFWSYGSCNNHLFCASMTVDINGEKAPNKAGVDYFSFLLTKNGIELPPKEENNFGNRCKYNDKSVKNGSYCSRWVIKKKNLDYLRRDISKEFDKL
jgi:prepilin-type N-terminal cleavage/methylation domain-containing protein